VFLKIEKILERKGGSARLLSLEESLCKGQWTCRKTVCRTTTTTTTTMMMMTCLVKMRYIYFKISVSILVTQLTNSSIKNLDFHHQQFPPTLTTNGHCELRYLRFRRRWKRGEKSPIKVSIAGVKRAHS